MYKKGEKALGQSKKEVLSQTEVVGYYLRNERQRDYFKKCIIVKLNESLWLVDGIIVIKEKNIRERGDFYKNS